ncbi:hypothetical protein NIES2101_28185 [Calothrix sp. HK-06]|nr:hypothetical protein NIES2101_28185 [Calothrix sp. HK-06]
MPFEKIDNIVSVQNLISTNSQTTGGLLNSNQASSLDAINISSSLLGHSSYSSDLLYTSTNTSQNHKDEFSVGYSKWSQPGGKGTSVDITYSYSNLLDGELKGDLLATKIRSIVEEALKLWSKYTPLNFKEVKDSGPAPSDNYYSDNNNPQIRFGHHYIDGNGGVLAHAYYPGSGLGGDVHFDNGDSWSDNPSTNIDLLEVAVHEIGHALGLNHESSNEAVMNSYYGGRFKGAGTAFLLQDDINGIRDVYGSGIGSVTPLTSPGYQYYTFTYSYGNGDSYTGYGYAESNKYTTNQYIYDTSSNETGYKGNYQINSVTNYTGATSLINQVYVSSYYDGDSSKKYYTPASGSGSSGLGSEYGYLVSNNFNTYFGSKYYEADIL